MRLVTASGESVELGTTETTPTIGITDYSRRVTDDFGVTTVVERGFSRRLSVRLALPLANVDGLQQRLAALRATPVQWIADERFNWLKVRGFYKDFTLDIPGSAVSYCTLSVEGLAEAGTYSDPGGDPAPDDRSSTLRMLQPVLVTPSVLTSSTVVENDYAEWAAGTTYAPGARVIKAATHRVYESTKAANTGNDPAGASGAWLDYGATKRWAMFDQALGSATTAAGSLAVTLNVADVTGVALLDVIASTVRVQAAGYDRTSPASSGAITFLDLPDITGPVTVTVAGQGTVSVGTLLIGQVVGLGITEASPTAGITDYSRKVTDDFGEVAVVERAWAKRMTTAAVLRTDALDLVASRIAAVRARPSLWIGQSGLDSLTIYGFFKDFSIELGDTVSKLSLSIEGLSAAAEIKPLVDWPDVGDSAGTKPSDNATNSEDPTSPFGNSTVGDAQKVIAAQKLRVETLEQQTIPAINKAVAEANAAIAAAQAAADAAFANVDRDIQAATDAADAAIGKANVRLDAAMQDLADEVSRAQGADEELQRRIDTLVVDSGSNDSATRALIETEKLVRADGDRAISQRVDSVVTEYKGLDTATNSRITETATTLSSADRALGERITSVVTDYQGKDSATNTRITQTVSTLSDADAAIGRRIDSVQTDYKGLNSTTNTRITDTATALSDADQALGQRINAIVAEGGYDDTNVRAEITRVETAAIDRDGALGRRVDTVQASFVTGGGNFLSNTDFATLDGWSVTANIVDGVMARNLAGITWMAGGEDNLGFVQTNRQSDDNTYIQASSGRFAVVPGTFVQFYVHGASHRSHNWVTLFFFNAAGELVGYAGENTAPRMNNGGRDPNAWDQYGRTAFRVPDAAVSAEMAVRKYNTVAGATDSYAWFWRPYVGAAREGQNGWNPYVSGNGKAVQISASARVASDVATLANADQALGQRIDSVTTEFRGANSTTNTRITDTSTALSNADAALGRRIDSIVADGGYDDTNVRSEITRVETASVNRDGALGSRIDTITTDYQGRDSATNTRITQTATALSNADAAIGQRIDSIVANGGYDDTSVRTEISRVDTASATRDAAVGQRIDTLRSEYNGTAATVSQQAGTIADVRGRTAAYWRTTAVAGNNRAQITVSADANAGAGVDIVGDVSIAGDLLVSGSIVARKFNGASMSRIVSSNFVGSVTPASGQTISVPWNLALGVIPPLGRFIYEYSIGVVTNAGQRQVATYNGLPLYTDFVDDGGAVVQAFDAQGHSYQPRANSSDPVLATTDFDVTFIASVRRGNTDTGIVNQGDYYERQISATYTLQSIYLRVNWVAI